MMSDWDSGRGADGQFETPRPSWPDGTTYSYPLPFPLPQAVEADDTDWWPADVPGPPCEGEGRPPGGGDDGDDGAGDQSGATAPQPAVPPGPGDYPWPPAPYPTGLRVTIGNPGDWPDPGGGRGRRRWLIPGGIAAGAAVVGAAAVLLTGTHPGGRGGGDLAAPSATASATAKAPSARASMAVRMAAKPSPSGSPQARGPLTLAQAQAVLANYTAVNNNANARRSETLLATVEAGSSDAIDAGLYRQQQAAGNGPYPAFGPVQATYYLPRDEPSAGPRWFAVQVANAFTANPAKVTTYEYLLFTQSAAGGAWRDAAEPYLLSAASAPRVAVGADGLATAVSPAAGSVAVAPGALPAVTAASLDGTGAVADPGNLTDRNDQRFWQGKVPGGQVTDTHAAADGADGPEFALQTADGGALVFYTDAAQVTITPAPGSALRLAIAGFYSGGQALTRVTVSYLEQFATYDPPAGGGAPRVVADYSGITGAG
jgi:hypothetical protein